MIEISNDIHNTTVRVRAAVGDTLTPSQLRRIRDELCGIEDCSCGTVRDERYRLEDHPLGTYILDREEEGS
jgi:hypothetical protein